MENEKAIIKREKAQSLEGNKPEAGKKGGVFQVCREGKTYRKTWLGGKFDNYRKKDASERTKKEGACWIEKKGVKRGGQAGKKRKAEYDN